MAERSEDFDLLFTPTGDELPDLGEHIDNVVAITGKKLILPPNQSLEFWIDEFNALPNFQQRWCTRLIKIRPCIDYLKQHPGSVLCVGLRADEMHRDGLYGSWATYRYPLREWGWDKAKVLAYCAARGVKVPPRTDCAVCPYQRLGDWFRLWKNYPDRWARGEAWEAKTGHTFRSAQRDTWPAAMKDLRAKFEAGEVPTRALAREKTEEACRVCRM